MNAKSFLIAALGFGLGLILTAQGQQASPLQVAPSVTFQQGKVLYPKDGKPTETTNEVLVAGIALVQTNGVFTVNKGKERQLSEGQVIDSEGMLTSRDGSVVPVVNHLVVKNGRVLMVKDGVAAPLVGDFALRDGSKVTPDGSVRATDSRVRRLLDGQIFKLDGTTVPVTDTVSLQGGKVVLYKDGARMELRRGQFMAMNDNSRVSGDGYVIKPDGTRINLKEGELLKLPGVSTR